MTDKQKTIYCFDDQFDSGWEIDAKTGDKIPSHPNPEIAKRIDNGTYTRPQNIYPTARFTKGG